MCATILNYLWLFLLHVIVERNKCEMKLEIAWKKESDAVRIEIDKSKRLRLTEKDFLLNAGSMLARSVRQVISNC